MNSGSSALIEDSGVPENGRLRRVSAQRRRGQDSRTAVAFSEITFEDPPGSMVTP